jgi:hypothetical protein
LQKLKNSFAKINSTAKQKLALQLQKLIKKNISFS